MPNIFEQVEQLSDTDKKALLETQFPEELEKEAAAELDSHLLADALYSYGYLQGERELAEVDGLDKVAAETVQAFEAAEQEMGEQIDACLGSLGTAEGDDVAELHKEAQAAAALIFEGFSDCLEKQAAAGHMAKLKGAVKGGLKKLEGAAKKHGKGAAGGAAAGAAGGYMAKKHMDKKASDMTIGEIRDVIFEEAAAAAVINEGVEKLASKGAGKAASMMAKLKGGAKAADKYVKGNAKKYMAGAGLLGAAAGRASKD
jgi:hypothetical protein